MRDSAWEEACPVTSPTPATNNALQEVGPYMLRREKKEVFQSQDDAAAAAAGGGGSAASSPQGSDGGAAQAAAAGGASKPAAMPHKNDLIVWLKLKPMQKKLYQAFLNSGGWVISGLGAGGCHMPAHLAGQYAPHSACRRAPACSPSLQSTTAADSVKKVFNQTASALAAITVLKKVGRVVRAGLG